MKKTAEISAVVRDFYAEIPFNYYTSAGMAAENIESNSIERSYPDLHALLSQADVQTVYEFGCGAGWLSNSVALHYGKEVTGVDFAGRAISRAREVADHLAIDKPPVFLEGDLFDVQLEKRADLVLSMGVLHHTADAARAFRHIAGFVGRGRYIYVGLYHQYGRQEFLDVFREIMAAEGERAAMEHFAELTRHRPQDRTYLKSWFRDQVLHPHETLHTLAETNRWLDETGFGLLSTSINRFGAIDSLTDLYEQERGYAEISRRANREERRYFPGFFTFLARDLGGVIPVSV